MRLRYRYLLWVNGALLALWVLYFVVSSTQERRDLLRIEAHNLQHVAEVLRDTCFVDGQPGSCLPRMIRVLARTAPGVEIMVVDQASVVTASSVDERVGRAWREPDIDLVLRQGDQTAWKLKDHFHGDVAMLDVTLAVRDDRGHVTQAIHIARRMDLVAELMRGHRTRHAIWATVFVLLIGVVLNVVTLRWLIRPIGAITDVLQASRWAQPDASGGDELQRLRTSTIRLVADAEQTLAEKETLVEEVRGFNSKLEREITQTRDELNRAQAELVQKERLSAIGELAAGLAHEVRNPLHIIRGGAEILQRRGASPDTCNDVLEEVDRINRFVNNLLDYTRPLAAELEPTRLGQVLDDAIDATQRTHAAGAVRFAVDCPAALSVACGRDHLWQILRNLLSNAVEAIDQTGTIRISARAHDAQVEISITDDGRGIAPEDLQRVQEPFFTRRPGGTGLGLAHTRRLLALYGATLNFHSDPSQGTTVIVRLPETNEA